MAKPLAIDLFCGLGGWADGFLAEDYDVIGFDIERHDYGTGGYPGQLVLQDVLTLGGRQFRNAAVIVASPPCQEFSYMAMPWSRAKQIAGALRGEVPFPDPYTGSRTLEQLTALFNACFRIASEAGIPLVVENVKGAQPWVGLARAHFGSFYFWGDINTVGDAIAGPQPKFGELLRAKKRGGKNGGNGTWFNIAHGERIPGNQAGAPQRGDGLVSGLADGEPSGWGNKVPGLNWNGHGEPGYKPKGFNVTAAQRFREDQGTKQGGSGAEWFDKAVDERRKAENFGWSKDSPLRNNNSRSDSRKAASAQIAKIPFPLAQHIARVFKPA